MSHVLTANVATEPPPPRSQGVWGEQAGGRLVPSGPPFPLELTVASANARRKGHGFAKVARNPISSYDNPLVSSGLSFV